MKKIVGLICAVGLAFSMAAPVHAEETEHHVDYSHVMKESIINNDYNAGVEAERMRNEKIDRLNLNVAKFTFEDLKLLSTIIYAEAGSNWLDINWKMCVGEVVLNRVASPEFPNTVREVLEQPGQYYGKNSWYFNNLKPNDASITAALNLLNGQRLMSPSVVFQANFPQGSGVHTVRHDAYLGWTYFCHSNHPELYGMPAVANATEEDLVVPESEIESELNPELVPGEEVETELGEEPGENNAVDVENETTEGAADPEIQNEIEDQNDCCIAA